MCRIPSTRQGYGKNVTLLSLFRQATGQTNDNKQNITKFYEYMISLLHYVNRWYQIYTSNSLYRGRIGMQCLMYMLSMYRAIEIGTFSGSAAIWASSEHPVPLRIFVISLNLKCWAPPCSHRKSAPSTFLTLCAWQRCCPEVQHVPRTCQWLWFRHPQHSSSGACACRDCPHQHRSMDLLAAQVFETRSMSKQVWLVFRSVNCQTLSN